MFYNCIFVLIEQQNQLKYLLLQYKAYLWYINKHATLLVICEYTAQDSTIFLLACGTSNRRKKLQTM